MGRGAVAAGRFLSGHREFLLRAAVGVVATLAAYAVVYWMGLKGYYDLAFARSIIPAVFAGFRLTIEITAVVIPLGFLLGFLIGWGRTTRSSVLRGFGAVYVDFFRSMPPIVLIAFAFLLGLTSLGSRPHPVIDNPFLVQSIALWLAVFALSFHTSAYQAEIVRAGILSVPTGQTEAGDAIGMTRAQSLTRIVFPQALRVSLPALGNEFSSVIKDTSLLSVVGWLELSQTGQILSSTALEHVSLYAPIIVWLEIAVLYFVLTFAVNSIVRVIENASKVPGLEAARA